VHDPDVGFSRDPHVEMQQVIVILMNRSGQRIFDGNHSGIDSPVAERSKDLFESLVGHDFRAFA
jgi:hypothetical protein